ncbi:MAG: hypothetical protein ACE5DX_05300 [Candidatus Dojkabacteria bacterium]
MAEAAVQVTTDPILVAEVLNSKKIGFLAVDSGVGHHTMAMDLLNATPSGGEHVWEDLTQSLLAHCEPGSEVERYTQRLHFANNTFLTHRVAGNLPAWGYHVLNAVLDPIYGIVEEVGKRLQNNPDVLALTYKFERYLAKPFADYVEAQGLWCVVTTLTSSARIANVAKAQGATAGGSTSHKYCTRSIRTRPYSPNLRPKD